MALIREEFKGLEVGDVIHLCDDRGHCVIVDIRPDGTVCVDVKWPPSFSGEQILSWDETGGCIHATNQDYTNLLNQEETYLPKESVSLLATKWLRSGKISPADFERLNRAIGYDSNRMAELGILGSWRSCCDLFFRPPTCGGFFFTQNFTIRQFYDRGVMV